jgi:tetratricopeptide (TPR) repeat protein
MSHFLINKLPVTTHLKSQRWDKFGFLNGTMKNTVNKSIGIILPIVLFFLFSYASAQQKQDEPKDAKFYIDRGIAYEKKGQYDQAISDYTKALEIEPKAAGAYYYRGIAYVHKGQYGWAIDDFTKGLEIEPNAAGPYFYRAIPYYFKKKYDESWKDIKKAEDLGYKIPSNFLENLRKASGRQN